MDLVLRGRFKVVAIKQKTSAGFFEDLKVGDVFELRYTLNGRYKKTPYTHIYVDGVCRHINTASQLRSNLGKFELEAL